MRHGKSEVTRARVAAALRRARDEGYGDGGHVGQESFVTPAELTTLAGATGVTAGSVVLDVCCGTGGPALYLAQETGCRIIGVDRSLEAVQLAGTAAMARGLAQRADFLVGDAPRLPLASGFDVTLLLETMLAIEDKARLLSEFQRLLRPGGHAGMTLEVGLPLTREERWGMPEGDCIWLVTEGQFYTLLEAQGFRLRHVEDRTQVHADLARRLAGSFERHREVITADLGAAWCNRIIGAHARWVEWLTAGRIRKIVLVAERMK